MKWDTSKIEMRCIKNWIKMHQKLNWDASKIELRYIRKLNALKIELQFKMHDIVAIIIKKSE